MVLRTLAEWQAVPVLARTRWDVASGRHVGIACTGRLLCEILRDARSGWISSLRDISALVGGPAVVEARQADMPSDWRASLADGTTLVLLRDGEIYRLGLGPSGHGWGCALTEREIDSLPDGEANGGHRGTGGGHAWA